MARSTVIVTVFRSRLRPDAATNGYGELAAHIEALARSMPGFVDFKAFSAEDGERCSIIVFDSPETQAAWRDHPEHRSAQQRGRDDFYSTYDIQVAEVTRDRRWPKDGPAG